MERRDLYQDDLTEERYPSPARRDDEAATQTLDPDASADDNDQARAIEPNTPGGRPLGYPHGVPGGVHDDPEGNDDDDHEDDDEEDEELDDELND